MSSLPLIESSEKPLPRQRWHELGVWLVIVGLMTFVVYRNAHTNSIRSSEPVFSDLAIKLRAQEAIEFKLLQARVDPKLSVAWNATIDRLVQQMEGDVRAPEDKLRVAIVVGDLKGKDQALTRLDTLSATQISQELAADIAALRAIYAGGSALPDSSSQDRLIRRYGYFGQLALAYNVPSNTEPRKSIEESAQRMLVVLGFIGAGMLLLLVVSLGLAITGAVLFVKGRIQRVYVPEAPANGAFLEAFALYLVLFFLGFALILRAAGLTNLNWEWLTWLIIPLTVVWIMRRGTTFDGCRKALGWHSGRGWHREITAGLIGYVAGLLFVAVGLFITALLIKLTNTTPRDWITPMLRGNGRQILTLYVLACVFAPVIEETMFRGILFHHLRGRWGWLASAAVVSAIFALMHPQGWVALPALGTIAMVLAALREWRGSIIAPMAAHALNNFIVLTLALAILR